MSEEIKKTTVEEEKKSDSLLSKLQLRGSSVLQARAKTAYCNVQIQAKAALQQAKTRVYGIMSEIAEHEDVSVASTHDLKPGFKDNPTEWVKRGIVLHKNLADATRDYRIIKHWYDRLFPEGEVGFEEPNIDDNSIL